MIEKPFFPNSSLILNVNTFSPLQRILHHMFTTIIYLKDGSRDHVNTVHQFLFYYIFSGEQINLPSLIIDVLYKCLANKKRSLPYACHITSLILCCFPDLHLEEVSILQWFI